MRSSSGQGDGEAFNQPFNQLAPVVLRLATAVSTWPFYNFRYRKLLFELAKRFHLFVIAGSTLPSEKGGVLKPIRVLPLKLPRRIRYYVSPLLAEAALNIVDADVV